MPSLESFNLLDCLVHSYFAGFLVYAQQVPDDELAIYPDAHWHLGVMGFSLDDALQAGHGLSQCPSFRLIVGVARPKVGSSSHDLLSLWIHDDETP